MKITKQLVSDDEITRCLENDFNYPELSDGFTKADFEREFDRAHDILIEELKSIGSVNEGIGFADFSLSRHVDLNRSITIVLDIPYRRKTLRTIVLALRKIKEELGVEYQVTLDSEGAYLCISENGTVTANIHTNKFFGWLALLSFGFSPLTLLKGSNRVVGSINSPDPHTTTHTAP